jgi:hypothetical protein
MLDRDDLSLRDALTRDFGQALYGDRETPGLAQGIRAVQTWEQYQRQLGRIEGVELAQKLLDDRVRKMNGDEPERDHLGRMN